MGRNEIVAFSAEKKCAECGKVFFVPDVKVWKYRIPWYGGASKWFCIWSCMEHWRVKHEKPTKKDDGTICHTPTYEIGKYPNNLQKIREHFELSRQDVIAYIHCGVSTYSHLERGTRVIQPKWVARLCEGFGCRPVDILSDRFDEAAAESWECRIKKKSAYPPR